ncbi:MAG: stage II sporulation protein M [Dehalococcoidia bacterium]|nr:stage II sporulation protein M [Dehalococcoidia bacterium]
MPRFSVSSLGRTFVFSLALFAGSWLLGYWIYQMEGGAGVSDTAVQQLMDVLAPLGSLNAPQIMLLIFVNNALKALVVIVLGYTLGLAPFLFLVVNGLLIGFVVGEVASTAGPDMAIRALAPHGVLEVPALLLATALGFRVALAVWKRLLGRDGHPGQELKNGLAVYARLVLPALFVAALVETFVTPMVIGK